MTDIPDWCFVDTKKRLGYVAIPKAASTSIKAALFSLNWDTSEAIHQRSERHRMSIKQARGKGIFLFTVVRNPFDRAVSIWRNRVHEPARFTRLNRFFPVGIEFAAFADLLAEIGPDADLHTMAQATILMQPGGLLAVDMICRFERLERDWAALQAVYGLPALPLYNPSRQVVLGVYGAAERLKIKRVYAADVALLGYRFS